jgi:hypothetical protein
MRPLLATLIVFAGCIWGFMQYRDHNRARHDAVAAVVRVEPPAPSRSLEERAAAAQGTILPPQAPRPVVRPAAQPVRDDPVERVGTTAPTEQFHCDGRIYCSQMRSCKEATWFLQNCPGTRMDGDRNGNGSRGDGVPCEAQLCGDR